MTAIAPSCSVSDVRSISACDGGGRALEEGRQARARQLLAARLDARRARTTIPASLCGSAATPSSGGRSQTAVAIALKARATGTHLPGGPSTLHGALRRESLRRDASRPAEQAGDLARPGTDAPGLAAPARGRTVKRVVVRRIDRQQVEPQQMDRRQMDRRRSEAADAGGARAGIVSNRRGATLPRTAPRIASAHEATSAPRRSFEAGEHVEFQRARTLAISHYAFALLVFGGMFFV